MFWWELWENNLKKKIYEIKLNKLSSTHLKKKIV